MNLSPWLTFILEISTLGIMFWIIYKFFSSVLQSLKNTFFVIRHIDSKASWRDKTLFYTINFSNQLLSYFLLIFLIFLFPAVCIFVENFFNVVLFGGKTLSQFIAQLPSMSGTIASLYQSIFHWIHSFLHRLTS